MRNPAVGVVTTALLLSAMQDAQALTIKMGTMAPDGSSWHQAMTRIGERWEQASEGEVTLHIYAGGVVGDEGDTVKKMRIGQLQGAALTGPGLSSISVAPTAISTPLMLTSYDELDAVMKQVQPMLDRALEEKGFIALAWTDAGSLRFFGKKPAATPQQAAAQKIWAVSGDPDAVRAWQSAGFEPVVLSSVNVYPSLQTGMIDSFVASPMVALSLGWYRGAPNMTDVPLGMLIGALVVSKKSWDGVPAALRPTLQKIAQDEASLLRTSLREQEREAIDTMRGKGLHLVHASAAQHKQWLALEDKLFAKIRGAVVPADVFDAVKRARDAHRARYGKPARPGSAGP